MASLRATKTLKSAVAVIVSGALFVTSAAGPVAAQVRMGGSSEAGPAARASFTPPTLNGVQPLAAALEGPSILVPALSPAVTPSALTPVVSAAVKAGERPAETPPRSSASRGANNVRVAAPKTGLRAALVEGPSFLGRPGAETFDGSAARKGGLKDATGAASGERSAAAGLSKPSARASEIVDDNSIPTPEAARRVGEIRRALGTPLWAKIVAPLSVVAAAAVAIHFGAVPVLTLAAGLVVSVLAHEIAHIAVLHRLGDRTAEHAGSHSLNPLDHIDAVKTVIIPALSLALSSLLLPFPLLLGAGKPVDADFNNLRSPFGGPRSARNALWVAAAGPATNLAIAGLAFGAAALLTAGGVPALVALGLAKMNLALAAFNLLPLPQLDGGKILAGVLPERFYAKWVFNPRVERGYQGVFRRLYEGPANVLTGLADAMGVRTQRGVNRLANTVTFTALAAFYAAAYFQFALALPLLFLALPCSYDYWCIREKVRSEAAVQDLMELMSQWGAVIVQISEDLGLDSEVSAYETEHAMKNALETLVDEMMAKEEFLALSDEQKLEALMKAYPDKAAEYLKQKAMPEDSIEKIKAVLADPRNGPFNARLRKWFKDHEIFARWDNKHQKGKLKDALKDAEKPKQRNAGGPGGSALVALAALGLGAGMGLFPDWAPSVAPVLAGLSTFGMFGALGIVTRGGEPAPRNPMAKVSADPDMTRDSIVVTLLENAEQSDVSRIFSGLSYSLLDNNATTSPGIPFRSYRAYLPDQIFSTRIARRIARDAAVEAVVVRTDMREAMALLEPGGSPRRVTWTEKIKASDGYPAARVRAMFDNEAAVTHWSGRMSKPIEMNGILVLESMLLTRDEAVELARALADDSEVSAVGVSSFVAEQLRTSSRSRAVEPAPQPASARDPDWLNKISKNENYPPARVIAEYESKADAERAFASIPNPKDMTWFGDIKVDLRTPVMAAELASALAADPKATKVGVSGVVYGLLTLAATRAEAPAVLPDELAPAPQAALALPEKMSSHGKGEYAVNAVLVKFAEVASEADILAALARHGQNTLHRHGDMYTVSAPSPEQTAEKAAALAAEAVVAAVKIHPNVAAMMTEVADPYPDARSYDHERALIVEFRAGTTEEAIKEYAEVHRLELIYANFRGSERGALLEAPRGADFRATLRMLVDETAAAGASAQSARPFQDQPGDVELAPAAQPQAVAVEQPKPAVVPRRDPAQAWLEHLQNVTLGDGKSKLTDAQVKLLSAMLKMVARHPDAPRPPIVSRTEEVKRLMPIVTSPRGMRNSVILVGEAGVGKTAVAEGLAEMIEDAEHATSSDSQAFLQFERLKGRWLVELDINKVLTQEDPVGVLSMILDLLPRLNTGGPSRGNDVIVLMDEIQKFFLDSNGQKIANILKGPLRDGTISDIATTTRLEYKKFIESDDAFRRRFEKIDVEEPTVPQTTAMLRAMKGWLERLHDAVIPDEALASAAKLADQFDKTNFNPDKAIKAVQDAAELSRPDNLRARVTLDLRETWGELVVAANEARQALVDKGIASTLALPVDHYNKIAGLVSKAEALYAEREAVADGKGLVTTAVVKRVIAAKTGIASGQLNLGEDDAGRYTKMEEEIGRRVVNQDRALTAIANAVRRNKAGLSNPNRPMGKFLLTGPTGVGKTYLAKELARFLFNDPEAMIRMDMSEYMEEHQSQRLTGSPPGYIGYEEGGQLTEAVRKKPYSVILFDEVEKAHPKVFDVLLQILDDGRLTDGHGRTVDFKNTVIVMTSNAGMSGVDGEKYARLLAQVKDHNEIAEINKLWDEEIDLMVGSSLKERFRPEFLNRLDEDPLSKNKWIRVNRLRAEDMAKIAGIQLMEFSQMLADRHDTDIQFDPSVVDFLSVEGYSPLYGARPMTAAIEKNIIDPLASWILKEAATGKKDVRGALIKVSYADGKIVFTASKKPEKNTARATIQGASEAVASELFSLIESLAGTGEGEEPTENLFDRLMRKARPAAGKAAQADGGSAASRAKAFFAPGAGLPVNGAPVAAEHNNANKKDAAARALASRVLASAAEAGWSADVLQALDAPASGQGEGWLKQIVKLSKEQATKAGAAAAVTLAADVDKDAIRLSVGGAYALTEDDQRALMMHFSGAPPASYLAAQRKADNLNLSARLLWDHNLLDLYRRLAAVPGARMGMKTGPEGTQIWLEILRAPAAPQTPKVAAAASGVKADGTPHQLRETAKTRELLMRVIDQSGLKENERDGHAIRIAAAEGYAMLSTAADAAVAREWINAKNWAGKVVEPKVEVGEDWPLAMTAALILERFGGAEDVEMLENMSRRVTGTTHFEVPIHNALVSALASIYARLGLAATRRALERTGQLGGRTTDIAEAVKRALGTVGMPVDVDRAINDADGYLAMMKRLGRQDELRRLFWDTKSWGQVNGSEAARYAALKLVGETEKGPEALKRLKNMMKTQASYSRTGYEASRAWAAIVAREGLTRGLGDAIKLYLDTRDVNDFDRGKTWPILYAYIVTAALAGGADTLAPLEELMNQPPADIQSVHEQSYFNAPDAWARALIRGGKFEEYSRSPGLAADGSPKPSKLQEMLTSQTRPMFAAAALRAIAYARDPALSRRVDDPKGDLPEILRAP